MARKNRIKLDTRIGGLVTFTAAFTMMVIGLGFIIFFVLFTSGQNKENIEYLQRSVASSFGENILFLEDSIVSIRHNNEIRSFLNATDSESENKESLLISCMDIFSERNKSSLQEPFVSLVYLFNTEDSYINVRYYPETVSLSIANSEYFKSIIGDFKNSKDNYNIFDGTDESSKILAVKLYDDNLDYMGICAMELNLSVAKNNFFPIDSYTKSSWEIGFKPYISDRETILVESESNNKLSWTFDEKDVCLRTDYSFGLYSAINIDRANIYYNVGALALALLILSIPILIVIAIRLVMLIRESYERELIATKTRVKFLQSQLNPHFQYNVMAMLSIRAKGNGDDKLYESLRAYSNLARGKIFREGEIYISLKEEIELAKFYLQLQKDRFGDRLSYSIDFDREKTGDILIPKLIVEPLVENAVEHGIEPKGTPGIVSICAKVVDEMLEIIVADNGVGYHSNLTKTQTGTSFENTKKLLAVLYEDNHSIDLQTENNKGTQVTIRIPIKYD